MDPTYLDWLCVCCGAVGPGTPTRSPNIDQHHSGECPESARDEDPDAVREFKRKLAESCAITNKERLATIDARIRERKLWVEVQQLRAELRLARSSAEEVQALRAELLRNAQEVARLRVYKDTRDLVCPKCGSTSLLLDGNAPEHDVFHYRCRGCGTRFNASS